MDHSFQTLRAQEIPSVLEKASVFGGKIFQPSSVTQFSASIARIDIDVCGLIFIKLHESEGFDCKKSISIKLNYRDVSFYLTSQHYTLEGRTLIGQIPEEAKALPVRDYERYVFPLHLENKALIHRVEKRGGTFNGEVKLFDVSKKGVGIIISSVERGTLLAHDHIWIKSFNGSELEKPVFGRIVYAYERRFKDTFDIKCGVDLNKDFENEIFEDFKKNCRLVLRG